MFIMFWLGSRWYSLTLTRFVDVELRQACRQIRGSRPPGGCWDIVDGVPAAGPSRGDEVLIGRLHIRHLCHASPSQGLHTLVEKINKWKNKVCYIDVGFLENPLNKGLPSLFLELIRQSLWRSVRKGAKRSICLNRKQSVLELMTRR